METMPPPKDEHTGLAGAFIRLNRKFFNISAVILLGGMTLLIGADVILRLVAGAPVRGAHDIIGMALLMLFVCSLPYSWPAGVHVRMDMLYGRYGPGVRRVVDLISSAAALIFAILLAWQAARYVPHMYRVKSSTVTLGIPYWPFTIAIAISAALFALSIIVEAVLLFRREKP